jgi:hypothetical protein
MCRRSLRLDVGWGVDLHDELAERLRDAVSVGAVEQAALLAVRATEARVHDLTDKPRGKGRAADGPHADVARLRGARTAHGPGAERGERVGTISLFVGAFGAVRNRLVHTEMEWSDSIEAADYVLFADLLMRQIDRAADPSCGRRSSARSGVQAFRRSAVGACGGARIHTQPRSPQGGACGRGRAPASANDSSRTRRRCDSGRADGRGDRGRDPRREPAP